MDYNLWILTMRHYEKDTFGFVEACRSENKSQVRMEFSFGEKNEFGIQPA